MNEEPTQAQDKPSVGAVMDVRPPAKPTESPAPTVVDTEAPKQEPEAVEGQATEAPVVVETEQVSDSVASEDATEALPDAPSPSTQDEVAEAAPQPADEPGQEEPGQDQAAPLLAAKPTSPQKHGVRWVFVCAVLVVLALVGAAVAAYMASNASQTDKTQSTNQADTDSTTEPQLEDTQSAVGEAKDAVDQALEDQDATDFPETELADDQLGL